MLEYIALQNISRKGNLFIMFFFMYTLKGKSTSTFYIENCSQTKDDFAVSMYSEQKKKQSACTPSGGELPNFVKADLSVTVAERMKSDPLALGTLHGH